MTGFITRCRRCGQEFEPNQQAIIAATWRLCPTCRPQPTQKTCCRECGRPLRGTTRTLCAQCMGVAL